MPNTPPDRKVGRCIRKSVCYLDSQNPSFFTTSPRTFPFQRSKILGKIPSCTPSQGRWSIWGNILEFHFLSDFFSQVDITSKNNRTNVVRALHPAKVALLTLFNNAEGGGTRIMLADGTDFVVQAQAGDLLIFDNVDTEHGIFCFRIFFIGRKCLFIDCFFPGFCSFLIISSKRSGRTCAKILRKTRRRHPTNYRVEKSWLQL